MPYIEIDNLQLYYEDFGRGEPILFLHSSFSRGLLSFGAQIQPLQEKFRCIIPDFRGHGRTICDDLKWNSRKLSEDMIAFLDKLEMKRIHLVGYSMGAYVGMYMASKYPERVRSFISIGGGVTPNPNGSGNYLPEEVLRRNDKEFIEEITLRHFDAHKGNWQEFLRQTVVDWRNHPNMSDEEWQAIRCPVLFINGENDSFGSCKELKAKVPHAEIFEVKDCGHRPHFAMEHAKEVNERILKFLK